MFDKDKDRRILHAITPLSVYPLTTLDRHQPAAHCKPNECYDNVRRHIEMYGGSIQYGWIFASRWTYNYVIAGGHAVWKYDGALIDITPRLDVRKIASPEVVPLVDENGHMLFLPHDQGEQPHRFIPLTKNKVLIKKCRQCTRKAWKEWQDGAWYNQALERQLRTLGKKAGNR
jgi:hypothetical protein